MLVRGLAAGLLVLVHFGAHAQTMLRTEYQDSQPKFIALPGGGFGGLCVEIQKLLEKQAGVRFTFPQTFVPVNRIIEDLRVSKIDAFFGLSKTPQRRAEFLFVGELYRTRYQIVVAKGDPLLGVTSLERLRAVSVPVLVLPGSVHSDYFGKTLGLQVMDSPTGVEASLRQLKAGRGRMFGYFDLGTQWYMTKLGMGESLAVLPLVLDEEASWLCLSLNAPKELVDRMAMGLEQIKKAPEWEALMKKYLPGR